MSDGDYRESTPPRPSPDPYGDRQTVPRHEDAPKPHAAWIFVLGVLIVLMAAIASGVIVLGRRRHTAREAGARTTQARLGPRVSFVRVTRSPGERSVSLTGETRPYVTATLYAKISGYLRQIRVDRGDRVTAGQLLAVIDSPETDQQYQAAVHDHQIRALTAQRFAALVGPGAVSRQDADTAAAGASVSRATVAQIASQRSYELIRAPFAGTITARYADPGALVQSATGAQTGALPLVRISRLDRLRVFAYLDARNASLVRIGDPAEITVAERPEVHVAAHVTRIAGEIEPRTRTMLTEVDLDNPLNELIAGGFVEVRITLHTTALPQVASSALMTREGHIQVAVIEPDDRVRMRAVTVVDDDGRIATVSLGLHPDERVAVNLEDTVGEGERVRPVPAPPMASAPDAQHVGAPPGANAGSQERPR